MGKLDRYAVYADEAYGICQEVCTDGEWVKYSEYEEKMARLRELAYEDIYDRVLIEVTPEVVDIICLIPSGRDTTGKAGERPDLVAEFYANRYQAGEDNDIHS